MGNTASECRKDTLQRRLQQAKRGRGREGYTEEEGEEEREVESTSGTQAQRRSAGKHKSHTRIDGTDSWWALSVPESKGSERKRSREREEQSG